MNTLVTMTAVAMAFGVRIREPRLPTGPAPTQKVVRVLGGKYIATEEQLTKVATYQVKWGKPLQKLVTFTRRISYELGRVRVYDTRGRPVDPQELPKLLSKPTTVLIPADGKGVDPLYLRHVKKGTLIVVFPPEVAGRGPGQ